MRHFLLISAGTHGDVFPFVALGHVLRSRGHRVTLAVNERYGPLAGDAGFGFVPLMTEQETHEFLDDPDLWHPVKSALVGARWAARCTPRHYQRLVAVAEDPQVVMAASPGVLAARILHDKLQRPLASICYTPWMVASSAAPPAMTAGVSLPAWAPRPLGSAYWRIVDVVGDLLVGRSLNRLRRQLQLPPVRRIFRWWISPQLAIGLFPEWYAEPQRDWPPQMTVTGFPMYDGADSDGAASEALQFCRNGPPPIVFTFGTGMRHARDLYTQAVDACRRLGRRGMLLTAYADQLPVDSLAGVRAFSYVPFRQLLPHCAAVVHHGGIGTVAQSLFAGTPQLIVPHAWDQLDNARRVRRLGVGSLIKRSRSTAANLARALQQLLADDDLPARCQAIAERFPATDPLENAADLLEGLEEQG